jgi:hypothetical protein
MQVSLDDGVDPDNDNDADTVPYLTVYGSVEDLRAALTKPDADPNKVWFTRCFGEGIPETSEDYDPDGFNEWRTDTAVSLCFWSASGDVGAKLQLLLDHPATDAAAAMESVARLDIDEGAVPMLRRVKEWAAAKGVDVPAVYAAAVGNPATAPSLFVVHAG